MSKAEVFHSFYAEETIQVPKQYLVYRHPHTHLCFPDGYKIGYSDYEYNLMWKLIKSLKGKLKPSDKVAFIGLGPGVGPALFTVAFKNKLDVFEIDEQVIEFVKKEHPEYLEGFNLIKGDFVDTIKKNYDLIVFDVSLPENITDEHKAVLKAHLKPEGKVLTQPEWKELV